VQRFIDAFKDADLNYLVKLEINQNGKVPNKYTRKLGVRELYNNYYSNPYFSPSTGKVHSENLNSSKSIKSHDLRNGKLKS
jgi:hypothetical protein